jgi:drug/metabolite transporter (DMT)-like permease
MESRKPVLFALIAILMWSTAGTAFKIALKGLSFTELLFISSNVAWITLACYALFKGIKISFTFNSLSRSALNGLLNPFLYYLILLKAYTLLPAQIAQPLNYTWPIMLVLLSIIFLNQRLKWFDIIAIIISFSGVVAISFMGETTLSTDKRTLFGIILATGCSIVWAAYWILNVQDKRADLEKLLLNFAFGALFISLWLILGKGLPGLSKSWIPAIYVGLTEMAIAFVFWLYAMQLSENNSRIANLVFISPFLALVFIHLILKEQIYISTVLGLILIVSGIMLQQFMISRGKIRIREKNNIGD